MVVVRKSERFARGDFDGWDFGGAKFQSDQRDQARPKRPSKTTETQIKTNPKTKKQERGLARRVWNT